MTRGTSYLNIKTFSFERYFYFTSTFNNIYISKSDLYCVAEMRLLSCAIAIIWLGNGTWATETRDIIDKVEQGTAVAEGIIAALGDDQVSKAFRKIGTIAAKIGPFLGAIGPAIALLGLFHDSAELTAIKEGFADMDKKFDEVFSKFDEVDNLIRETSLKTQYVSYEYASSNRLATSNIWQGMMGKGVFSTIIAPLTSFFQSDCLNCIT